jgi:hypothetical protein
MFADQNERRAAVLVDGLYRLGPIFREAHQ